MRIAACVLLGLLSSLMLVPTPARAEVGTHTRVADKVSPAVHLLMTTYSGDVLVPSIVYNVPALKELAEQIKRQVQSGVIPPNAEAAKQAVVDAFAKNPLAYFNPGTRWSPLPVEFSGICTAWGITPDGVMVSAAHCVEKDEKSLISGIAETALQKITENEVKNMANSPDTKFSADQIKQLIPAIQKWYLSHIKIDGIQQKLTLRISEAAADGSKIGKAFAIRVLAKGESYPGKDYAILKADGLTNAPTIPVGDDNAIVAGTNTFVTGFTGASTFFPGASVDAINQPSIAEGAISAVKSNDQGVPYFQSQAPAGPGNSGGPVLNEKGEAIGILVAGSVESSGQRVDGQQWVLPIRVAQEAIRAENLQPVKSQTTSLYEEALELYYDERFIESIPKFEEVKRLYPSHAYVTQFLQKAQTAVSEGRGKKPTSVWVLVAGISAVVVGVGATIGIIVMIRRRKKAATAQAPSPAPGHAPAMYPAGQPYPQPQQPAMPQSMVSPPPGWHHSTPSVPPPGYRPGPSGGSPHHWPQSPGAGGSAQ